MPHNGVPEADELLLAASHYVRSLQVRAVRDVRERVPDGCGHARRCAQPPEWNRVHPVPGVREELFAGCAIGCRPAV